MTLIAFATTRTSADILTDSTAYTLGTSAITHCTKAIYLAHLETTLLSQGHSEMGRAWQWWAMRTAGDGLVDFDDLVRTAPDVLRAEWASYPDGAARTILAAVGYSPDAERFQAYTFPSDEDFVARRIDGLFVYPSPLGGRPSRWELREAKAAVDAGRVHPETYAALVAMPAPPVPANDTEWANVAQLARKTRTLVDFTTGLKVHVGGSVFHTHLERGQATTRKILEFDQDPEEFRLAVAGTLHPQGQLGPCYCGSSRSLIDCCAAVQHNGKPCLCGSGSHFEDCCSVYAAASATVTA